MGRGEGVAARDEGSSCSHFFSFRGMLAQTFSETHRLFEIRFTILLLYPGSGLRVDSLQTCQRPR